MIRCVCWTSSEGFRKKESSLLNNKDCKMDEAELGLECSFRGGLELQNILLYFSSQTVYGICYGNY